MIVVAAVLSALFGVATTPYLAGLTLSASDRDDAQWWRGRPSSGRRRCAFASITAVLAVLAGVAIGPAGDLDWPPMIAAALAAPLMAALFVVDLETKRLPNRLVFAVDLTVASALVVGGLLSTRWPPLLRSGEAAALVFGLFLVVVLISPKSFGYGDVKLLAPLAALLGWFGWLIVYYGILLGFVLGAAVAVGQILTRRANRKSSIPFGPSLILGTFIVLAVHRSLHLT